MGKIAIEDVDKYSGGGGAKFFKLENDKDTARVRFMYNTIDDVQFDVVHEIEVGDRKKYVSCLRSYNDPIDDCPLCKAGLRQQVKLFIPLYNEDTGETQIWQRGKSFVGQLSGLCSRFNPLVGTVVEIERNGRKGENTTRYQLYTTGSDNTTLKDLPEVPDGSESIVATKSYEELQKYIETGSFDSDVPKPRAVETITRRPINPSGKKAF